MNTGKRQKKLLTVCFILRKNEILLAMKKRGFGEGKWNGYGGKVADGETVEAAAKRETAEESGVRPELLDKRAILTFEFESDPVLLETHVFVIGRHTGEPQETEEMRPQWFALNSIPYSEMWADDQYWFPYLLSGKKFRGHFFFKDQATLIRHTVFEVAKLID